MPSASLKNQHLKSNIADRLGRIEDELITSNKEKAALREEVTTLNNVVETLNKHIITI